MLCFAGLCGSEKETPSNHFKAPCRSVRSFWSKSPRIQACFFFLPWEEVGWWQGWVGRTVPKWVDMHAAPARSTCMSNSKLEEFLWFYMPRKPQECFVLNLRSCRGMCLCGSATLRRSISLSCSIPILGNIRPRLARLLRVCVINRNHSKKTVNLNARCWWESSYSGPCWFKVKGFFPFLSIPKRIQ